MSHELEQLLGLGKSDLKFLEQLPEKKIARLKEMFEQARQTQRVQVDEAIESGLQIVPGFLRKTVRKVLGDKKGQA